METKEYREFVELLKQLNDKLIESIELSKKAAEKLKEQLWKLN